MCASCSLITPCRQAEHFVLPHMCFFTWETKTHKSYNLKHHQINFDYAKFANFQCKNKLLVGLHRGGRPEAGSGGRAGFQIHAVPRRTV